MVDTLEIVPKSCAFVVSCIVGRVSYIVPPFCRWATHKSRRIFSFKSWREFIVLIYCYANHNTSQAVKNIKWFFLTHEDVRAHFDGSRRNSFSQEQQNDV